MKCIRCHQDAEYLFEGNSLCNSHFEQMGDNGSFYQASFETLIEQYTGNKATIYKFLNEIKKSTYLTRKQEYIFLQKIVEMAERFPVAAINNAMYVAMKNGVLKLKYIYTIVSKTSSPKQEESSDFTNNDEYAKMIADKRNRSKNVTDQ